MNLISPTWRTLSPVDLGPDEPNDVRIHLFNDASGQDAVSEIVISGGLLAWYAFILDAKSHKDQTRFDKMLYFERDTWQEKLAGRFSFKFSQPIPAPPNWARFGR